MLSRLTIEVTCSLREFLDTDYVEACVIFKEHNGKQYLECRYFSDTNEKYPGNELANRRDEISEICAREAFE